MVRLLRIYLSILMMPAMSVIQLVNGVMTYEAGDGFANIH